MAEEKIEYLGRSVVIETFGEEGRWGWRFRIGGEPYVVLKRSPAADESEARAEATFAARSVLVLREGRA